MFGGYGYNKRVAIILAVSILLPCVIILCIFVHIKVSEVYENLENEVRVIIDEVDGDASEIASSVYQKANFITSYSELNDALQETGRVTITPETVVRNRTINNTLNALFSDNESMEVNIYTSNKNAEFLSAVDFVDNFHFFFEIPEQSLGVWKLENGDISDENSLSFYKKYSVLNGYYNVIKITIPFKSILKPFSSLKYNNSYIKIGNEIYSFNNGKYIPDELPDGNFQMITGVITPFNMETKVYIDKIIIYQEFLKILLYVFFGFVLLVVVILFVSNFISNRLMKGITDIVEGIRNNNMDMIRNSHYKSRETDIIKEYLFELQQNLKDENEEKLKFESELLTGRLSPHFLYNNLSAIKSNCVDEKSRKAIDRLVRYYRNVFQKGSQETTVRKEVENGIEYLQLLRFSYECDFRIDVKIAEECEELNIPSNILQPVLENAFIHGINDCENNCGVISISAYIKDNDLFISIVDNAGNFDKEHYEKQIHDKKKKHAIAMIMSRMKLYYKDEKYTVKITGNDEYTQALFRFRRTMQEEL